MFAIIVCIIPTTTINTNNYNGNENNERLEQDIDEHLNQDSNSKLADFKGLSVSRIILLEMAIGFLIIGLMPKKTYEMYKKIFNSKNTIEGVQSFKLLTTGKNNL